MDEDEKLKELITKLVEVIQSSIQDSSEVHSVLKEIEEHGFTLNLSLLVGIFIRDKDGLDVFFSSLGNESGPESTPAPKNNKKNGISHQAQSLPRTSAHKALIPPQGTWTQNDLKFLKSLGICPENIDLNKDK